MARLGQSKTRFCICKQPVAVQLSLFERQLTDSPSVCPSTVKICPEILLPLDDEAKRIIFAISSGETKVLIDVCFSN